MSRWSPRARDWAEEATRGTASLTPTPSAHPLLPDAKEASSGVSSSPQVQRATNGKAQAKKAEPTRVRSQGGFVDPLSSFSSSTAEDRGGKEKGKNSVSSDPLSAGLSSAGKPTKDGEAKKGAKDVSGATSTAGSSSTSKDAMGFVPWSSKRTAILARYTTDESIGVQASFVEGSEEVAAASAVAQQSKAQQLDRTQQRLAQLEQSDEHKAKQTLMLSQKEYEAHINKLHDDMITFWNAEDRVKSLKIAIQCAKLLGDRSVIRFYPSKFVLITEILDTFGRLVYERINDRGFDDENPVVSEQARGTCRNWFYKIASIRELLPRLYVEMAILRSIRFIQKGTFPTVISRVARQIRGIGDPLFSVYARAYLARKGHEVAPDEIDYLKTIFSDHVTNQSVIQSKEFRRMVRKQAHTQMMKWRDYLDLYSPALDWILQCVGSNSKISGEIFEWVLQEYERGGRNPFVLKHIISSFNPRLIAENGRQIVKLVGAADGRVFPKYQLYTSLGVVFSMAPPPRQHVVGILNDVWTTISVMKDAREYLAVAEVFVEFPLKYLGSTETNILLGDVLEHVIPVRDLAMSSGLPKKRKSKKKRSRRSRKSKDTNTTTENPAVAPNPTENVEEEEEEEAPIDGATLAAKDMTAAEELYEDIQGPLQSLIEKILGATASVSDAFALENLVPLLDCFTGEAQVNTYKSILKTFGREEEAEQKKRRQLQADIDAGRGAEEKPVEPVDVLNTSNNPQLVHAMFTIGKAVHDSVNTLTFADERRQIAAALCAFVQKIDYGRNFEKQLDFYTECRRAFGGLDPVKEALVMGASELAVRTLQLVNGHHNAKTTAFVRASLAFCYITIPSMESVQTRLRLYLVCAEAALLNQAVSQADGLLKACVKLVQETPQVVETVEGRKPTQQWLLSFLGNLCGLLAMTPGHPEQGPFYLVKGLLQVLNAYEWKNKHSGRARAFLAVMPLLTAAYAQRKLPYSLPKVEGNDVLYNLDAEYVAELEAITAKILETLLEDIAALGNIKEGDEAVSPEEAQREQAVLSLEVFNQVLAFCELNPKSATFMLNLFGIVKKELLHQREVGATDQRLNNYAKQTINAVKLLGERNGIARELHKKLIQ